jgi:hypothetical protein
MRKKTTIRRTVVTFKAATPRKTTSPKGDVLETVLRFLAIGACKLGALVLRGKASDACNRGARRLLAPLEGAPLKTEAQKRQEALATHPFGRRVRDMPRTRHYAKNQPAAETYLDALVASEEGLSHLVSTERAMRTVRGELRQR